MKTAINSLNKRCQACARNGKQLALMDKHLYPEELLAYLTEQVNQKKSLF